MPTGTRDLVRPNRDGVRSRDLQTRQFQISSSTRFRVRVLDVLTHDREEVRHLKLRDIPTLKREISKRNCTVVALYAQDAAESLRVEYRLLWLIVPLQTPATLHSVTSWSPHLLILLPAPYALYPVPYP